MQLLRPPPEIVPCVVRAMKTVALAAGSVHPGARALIEAAQDALVGRRVDFDALAPIEPAELAAQVQDPALRAQIVHGMVTVSLVDEIPSRQQIETVQRFAAALGVADGMLETVEKLVAGHLNVFRICFLRRSHIRDMMAGQIARAGVLGTIRAEATMMGWTEDEKLAERYARLADLRPGTLGHELHAYYVRNGFPWPGQRRAAPEAIVSHDVTHLVSGYDTDPVGETLVAAFTAGYQTDPRLFFTALVGLVMFSTGVHVAPSPNVQAMHVDAMAQPGVARRWFHALERGSRMTSDLAVDFELWPLADLPLEQLRQRWGVVPE